MIDNYQQTLVLFQRKRERDRDFCLIIMENCYPLLAAVAFPR